MQANTVHHILPREQYPEYQWEPWNLVALSAKTHDQMHDRVTGSLTDAGKVFLRRVENVLGNNDATKAPPRPITRD